MAGVEAGGVNGAEVTFAALSGWPLIAAVALVLLVAAWGLSRRLLIYSLVVVEALLIFWIFSLWRLV